MMDERKRRIHTGAGLAGAFWFAGWLFTISFVGLIWWKIILGIVVWPYYLGLLLHH